MLTGKTPNISEYLDFNFYDLVWYWRSANPSLLHHDRELAWWMGAAHRIGSDMCYWLMPVSGIPIVNTTVQHVTMEEMHEPKIKQRADEFEASLRQRLDNTNFILPGNDIDHTYPLDIYEIPVDGSDLNGDNLCADNDTLQPEADNIESYDRLIGSTFLLDPLRCPGNVATKAKVISRKLYSLGNPIGKAHKNPLLDT